MRYSVHKGPKGGAEFRQWTGEDTFRVVSRYVAWPNLSEEQRAVAEDIIGTRKAKAKARAQSDADWRAISQPRR